MRNKRTLHLVTRRTRRSVTVLRPQSAAEGALRETIDGLQATQIEVQARNEVLAEANEGLKDANDLAHEYYENSPIGYITLDQDLVIRKINRMATLLLHGSYTDILEKPFVEFVSFWDSSRFREMARRAGRSRQGKVFDLTLQRQDGAMLQAQCDLARMTIRQQVMMRVTLINITERKQAEADIKHLAFHDPLTTLPNRRLLLDRLQHTLTHCARTGQHGAVYFLDLDHFKLLNDTFGHAIGDLLLQQVALRLLACVGDRSTVARLGGDEFVVVVQDLGKTGDAARKRAQKLGSKLQHTLEEPYTLACVQHYVAGSLGVTVFQDISRSVDTLLKHADLALYAAKTAGRNKVRFFDPAMEVAVVAQSKLDSEIRRGLRDQEFLLYYQPQVDEKNHLVSVEALLRWQHPQRGLLLPGEFIAYAEEKGLIGLLGEQVLETAFEQLKAWSLVAGMAEVKMAINVSALEFCHSEFVRRILRLIDRTGVDASKIILEFTERTLFSAVDEISAKMKVLKKRGITFALDDFGIGYSSLASLHALPLDQLKIDRTFVRDITTNRQSAAITRSIIALGQNLGLDVLAEGVETIEQQAFLASHRCHLYQGYLFGRPEPPEQLLSRVMAGREISLQTNKLVEERAPLISRVPGHAAPARIRRRVATKLL